MTGDLSAVHSAVSATPQNLFQRLEAARTQQDALAAIESYIHQGHKFSPTAKGPEGRNELMEILRMAGAEGMRFFLNNGGILDQHAVDDHHSNEAMHIALWGGCAGVNLFIEHKGRFNPFARNRTSQTEARVIAEHARDAWDAFEAAWFLQKTEALRVADEQLLALVLRPTG